MQKFLIKIQNWFPLKNKNVKNYNYLNIAQAKNSK